MTKTILALDTATEACSVALGYKNHISRQFELSPRIHTQRILPMIDEILAQNQLKLTDVDYLAFGRGPGSFTGVRVGVSVAQGIAFGANLPVVEISNLLTMAEEARQKNGATEVVALIDARMDEVYFAQFHYGEDCGWQNVVEEQVCSPEKAIAQIQPCAHLTVVGTGWEAYPQFSAANLPLVPSEITLPRAEFMLSLAETAIEQGRVKSAMDIEPVYLRNEVTWQKLPHKR